MQSLISEIKNCRLCQPSLDHEPRPVLSIHEESKIIIIGQAPGSVVHKTGIPWDDQSGKNLRDWLGVDTQQFYNPKLFALLPMGFCYPGKGKSGDLPPRPECAPKWHETIISEFKQSKLTILIGNYAQAYYLPYSNKKTLTERVKKFDEFLPRFFVLPHPSPRNNIWQAKNPWFQEDVIPALREAVKSHL